MRRRGRSFFEVATRLCLVAIVAAGCELGSESAAGPPPVQSPATDAKVEQPVASISGFTFVEKNKEGYPEYRHDQTGIVFVKLPGGEFTMGGTEKEERDVLDSVPEKEREFYKGWLAAEKPRHEVTLSPFLIAKYEVTQAEWKRVMGTNPSRFKGDDLPVESLSWDHCQRFCEKVGLSLPTEAQWEYACRAGTTTPFAFGEQITPDDVNYHGSYPYGGAPKGLNRGTTVTVKDLQPNGFGLYHMHGNVWEWCQDNFDEDFYSKSEARGVDPLCTSGLESRVLRGGSWLNVAGYCRSAFRYWVPPSNRNLYLGFRPSRLSP